MATQPEFIESTAGKVAEELARRGIPPAQRVTITIEPDEPDDWIAKARAFARPKVGPMRISIALSTKNAPPCSHASKGNSS